MSTRSSIAYATAGTASMHLYVEMLDNTVHLEIKTRPPITVINVIIPPALIVDVAAIVRRAEDRGEGWIEQVLPSGD